MNWACDACNRTTTVANSGNRSLHEMFCGETPQSSPIPLLKPGFCKFERTNKMDRSSESKRVLVQTENVIITRSVTWAHAPLSRSPTASSTPLVEGEGCDHGKNRKASSFGGDTESRYDESESSGEAVEMVTSEANGTERENIPLVAGRAVSTTSSAGSSVHSGVSFDPKGRGSFGEGLADAPATFDSFSHGFDQQFSALRAGEANILAEHIPRPQRATIF